MRRFHARGRGRSARIEKWFSHMKIVVAEKQDDQDTDLDDNVIEGAAIPTPAASRAAADHAVIESTLAVPATEGTEAEAAEQAMSADAVARDQVSAPHEAGAAVTETPMTDHVTTDPMLALAATEGTEAEAAQQAMSDDAAHVDDEKATEEQRTPPGNPGQGAA